MNELFILILFGFGVGFLGWSIYQINVGEAYTKANYFQLHRKLWVGKTEAPATYWFIVISQFLIGIFLIIAGVQAITKY